MIDLSTRRGRARAFDLAVGLTAISMVIKWLLQLGTTNGAIVAGVLAALTAAALAVLGFLALRRRWYEESQVIVITCAVGCGHEVLRAGPGTSVETTFHITCPHCYDRWPGTRVDPFILEGRGGTLVISGRIDGTLRSTGRLLWTAY